MTLIVGFRAVPLPGSGRSFAFVIDALGSPHERIDEGMGNVTEHGSDQPGQHRRGELIVQFELDLASGGSEGKKPPRPAEPTKRALSQLDGDPLRAVVAVGGNEMRGHAVVVDVETGQRLLGSALEDGRAAAPRQELRIVFDGRDELEHLLRAVGDEHRLLHAGHCYNTLSRVSASRTNEYRRKQKSLSRLFCRGEIRGRARPRRLGSEGNPRRTRAAQGGVRRRQERRDRAARRACDAAADRLDAYPPRPDSHPEAPDAPPGNQSVDRQGRAGGLHAHPAESPLYPGPHQARDRTGARQEAVRQARDDQGTRMETRAEAGASQPSGQSTRMTLPPRVSLRAAAAADVPAIARIYREQVATGTA